MRSGWVNNTVTETLESINVGLMFMQLAYIIGTDLRVLQIGLQTTFDAIHVCGFFGEL